MTEQLPDNSTDTIAAIATPIGSGGIGVIRISGTGSIATADAVFHTAVAPVKDYPSHTAHHGKIVHPVSGETIDDAVLTIFRTPKSYTGEDVIELSCHGGYSTLRAVLSVVLQSGARLAEPGEFTKRAFLNGRIDLTQAEAVNDLIRARTDGARKVALRQLDGKLSHQIEAIRNRILAVIAAVEAAIDFPEDVPEPQTQWLRTEIEAAQAMTDSLRLSFNKGRIYREGLRVVIAGEVNVGKSSLLNALLRHARAIVTPIPGTTRDAIEESLEIEGIPVVAIDTAGLRTTDDPVERIGVDLTRKTLESADVVVLVIDANRIRVEPDCFSTSVPTIVVLNKIDLVDETARVRVIDELKLALSEDATIVAASAETGYGIDTLEQEIAKIASMETGAESAVVSNIRHMLALESASDSLKHAIATVESGKPIDFLSVDLLACRNQLGLIIGETASEDLLDRIFSEFCIGK